MKNQKGYDEKEADLGARWDEVGREGKRARGDNTFGTRNQGLGANQEVIDGNKYQLDDEANQTHHEEPHGDEPGDLAPFIESGLGALVQQMDRVLLELNERLQHDRCGELFLKFVHLLKERKRERERESVCVCVC